MEEKKKLKHVGINAHRLKDNPEELAFANAWDVFAAKQLKYLLCPPGLEQRWAVEPADDARVVAATVVQWLGSPVGRSFLRELGYVRIVGDQCDRLVDALEDANLDGDFHELIADLNGMER